MHDEKTLKSRNAGDKHLCTRAALTYVVQIAHSRVVTLEEEAEHSSTPPAVRHNTSQTSLSLPEQNKTVEHV